jgi:hypothetical protein
MILLFSPTRLTTGLCSRLRIRKYPLPLRLAWVRWALPGEMPR